MKSDPKSAMKALMVSPQPAKSSAMEDSHQSSYYPGCRKDANCSCEICLDSINATLDLMPMSVQKTNLSKLSASKPAAKKTLVSIDPSLLSTPNSRTSSTSSTSMSTPIQLRSTAKTGCCGEVVRKKEKKDEKKKRRKVGFGLKFLRWVLLVVVILGFEFGGSKGVFRVLKPRLSGEVVKGVIEESLVVKGLELNERLALIQRGLEEFVHGEVSNCNLGESNWRINQDGLILSSQCTLHKSAAEEVIIWGWPLQTSGLLTSGFSSRSLTVLSGRVTQWSEGHIVSTTKEVNASWVQQKWGASVVQLDPNTWVVEYKQNMLLENPSVCSTAFDLFKFGMSRVSSRMKQKFWGLRRTKGRLFGRSEAHSSIPT